MNKKYLLFLFIFLISIASVSAALNDAVVYYSFDTDATDDSGNDLNLSVTGSPSHNATGGVIGGMYIFGNSASDKLTQSDIGVDVNDVKTISFWYYYLGTGNNYLVNLGSALSSGNLFYSYASTSATRISTYAYDWNYGSGFPANEWHHEVYQYDGSVWHRWHNGAYLGNASLNTNVGTGFFTLGNFYNDAYALNGYMDEVGVWSRMLSFSEISVLYNGGVGFNPFNIVTPEIQQDTYNHSTAINVENETVWQSDRLIPSITRDDTPTIRFNTTAEADCRIHTSDQNWTTMGTNRNCSTTGSFSHVCTLNSDDALGLGTGYNELYIGCADLTHVKENVTSTSGPLNVSLDLYNLTGYVLNSSGTAIQDAKVGLVDQDLMTMYTNTTSDSDGIYSAAVYAGNWIAFAYDPNNSTLLSAIQHFISVS